MMRGKGKATLELIKAAKAILEEIQPASVRAVCYHLFVLRLIKDMSKASTNCVGKHLVYAREIEDPNNDLQIPWAWIVDEFEGR